MLVQFPTADSLVYPLVDEDNASALITKDKEMSFLGKSSNYGNLYWSNEDGSTTISWRGSPHRYYRIPDNIDIPSLSRYFSGRALKTVFSNLVYKEGKIYAATPFASPVASYIMGASEPSSLIVIALQDTESSFDTVVWKTDTPNEDYEKCNWIELNRWNTGRTELPYFPSVDGLTFTSATGSVITLDKELKTVKYIASPGYGGVASFSARTTGYRQRFPTIADVMLLKASGTELRVFGDHYWESIAFSQSYQGNLFFDNDKKCTITLSSDSTSPPVDQEQKLTVKKLDAKPLSPGELTIIGPSYWTGNNHGDFTAVNNAGSVKWTWPETSCGQVSIKVDDNCGRTASKIVAGSGGTWQDSVDCFPDQSPLTASGGIDGWFYVSATKRWRIVDSYPMGGIAASSCMQAQWHLNGSTCCYDDISSLGAWVAKGDGCSYTGIADGFCDGSLVLCGRIKAYTIGDWGSYPEGCYGTIVVNQCSPGHNYAFQTLEAAQSASGTRYIAQCQEYVCV